MSYATAVSFDADCMRRYDREGPRYTSYPTAQHFADGLAPDAYERAAATSLRRSRSGTRFPRTSTFRFAPVPASIAAATKSSPTSWTASMPTLNLF